MRAHVYRHHTALARNLVMYFLLVCVVVVQGDVARRRRRDAVAPQQVKLRCRNDVIVIPETTEMSEIGELPDVFFVSPEKTGTTALFQSLITAPGLTHGICKEIGFWNNHDWFVNGTWNERRLRASFPTSDELTIVNEKTGDKERMVTVDASPGYFGEYLVGVRMLKFLPDLQVKKFLSFPRNPTTRFISRWMGWQLHKTPHIEEKRNCADSVNAHLQVFENYMAEYGHKSQLDLCTHDDCQPTGSYHIFLGAYIHIYETLWEHVAAPGQLLVVPNELFYSLSKDAYSCVLRHVGIREADLQNVHPVHGGSNHATQRDMIETELCSADDEAKLNNAYAPYNRRLRDALLKDKKYQYVDTCIELIQNNVPLPDWLS